MKLLYYVCVPREGHQEYGGAVTVAWDTVDILRKYGVEVVVAYYLDWNRWSGSKWQVDIDGELRDEDDLESILRNYKPEKAFLNDILTAKHCKSIKKAGLPIIQEVHGPCFPVKLVHRLSIPIHKRWKEFCWELRHRYMCRFATLGLRPSHYAAESVITNYRIHKDIVKVIYNSVNLDLFIPTNRQLESDDNERCVFINAGRMAPNRNFLKCIQAFEKILENYPKCELKLAGDGYQMDMCKQYVLDNKIPNVHFLGSISRKQLAQHYQESDILLNTSEFETFGCVIVEAMATGLPVLAYNITSIPEVAPHGEVGFLSELYDIDAQVGNAIKLIRSPELRIKLGTKGRKYCEELYSENSKLNRLVEIFQESIND